ncbi:MAG: histidine kinase [Bacteroidota bacterium]
MQNQKTIVDRVIQNWVLSHLLFWTVFPVVYIILASLNSGNIGDHIINYAVLFPGQFIAAYLFNYYQIPKLLFKRKYVSFIISFILSAYFFSALARLMVVHIAEPFIRADFIQESFTEIFSDPLYLFSVYFPAVYLVVFLMLGVKTIKERFEQRTKMEILEKEKANTELKFLKTQMHPHFLFNTLNNLYALTLTKSDAAPQVVLKLSEMLDFMLYHCDQDSIKVQKEIEVIQSYIELELLRYGNQVDVSFDHSCEKPDIAIAPLILLSFVENAFKHGCSINPKNAKIKIDLSVRESDLHFKVSNSKPIDTNVNPDEKARKGIGSQNAARQLELNYPNKHRLTVTESDKNYLIELMIDLC